jgi:hypothetical protein
VRRSRRLGFGNPKLGFRGGGCGEAGGLDSAPRSLDSVEVDATKRAWRLGFGNNCWICVVNFAIQNELQRFLGTFL